MQFFGQHTFPQPREAIFDFFTNLHNEPRWNPQLRHVELTSPGPVGRGTTWLLDYRQVGKMQVVTTEFERPARVAWQVRSPKMDMEIRCRLEAGPGQGCTIRMEASVEPKGLMRLLGPFLKMMMARDFAAKGQQVQHAYEQWERESAGIALPGA